MLQETRNFHLTITIPFPNSEQAAIVYNTLRVDPEPKRSQVTKTLSTEEKFLIAHLQKRNMVLLDNDTFLTRLTIMFHKARNTGSVCLTMKRYDGRSKHLPKDGTKKPDPQEYMCLLRASLSNSKISTVVHPKDVNKFQQAYCSLLRGNMDGLKKIKKTKTKAKATQ